MTSTIENAFGSRVMVRGFLLNNELTDFSFVPEQDGRPVANRIEPGKRPRSSMAPTIAFDRAGAVRIVLGSPGGASIINYVVKTLVGVIDWELNIQEAISLPNFGSQNGPTLLEQGTVLEALAEPLEALGHEVRITKLTSGLHGITRFPFHWVGGADPRREGIARGAVDRLPEPAATEVD
jgi:gamma-glutamyltranspeptidase/glutathione hydrolase